MLFVYGRQIFYDAWLFLNMDVDLTQWRDNFQNCPSCPVESTVECQLSMAPDYPWKWNTSGGQTT